MDPKAALYAAIDAWLAGEWDDAIEALDNYVGWRRRGGFEPDLSCEDAQVVAFAAKHPGAVLDADHIAANLRDTCRREERKAMGLTSSLAPTSCPLDGGDAVPLGTLGNRAHFRCRSCGIDFSTEAG